MNLQTQKSLVILAIVLFICSWTYVSNADEAFNVSGVLNNYEKIHTGPATDYDKSFLDLVRELDENIAKSPPKKMLIAIELVKRALNKTENMDNRRTYLKILHDGNYSDELHEKELGALESAAGDVHEELGLRIQAILLLQGSAYKNNRSVKAIEKELGFESVKTDTHYRTGFNILLANHYDDQEVRTFLYDYLKTKNSPNIKMKKDLVLGVMGMKKDEGAVENIIALLDNPKLKGTYTFSYAAYVLGYIGGEKATRYLIGLVPKVKDWLDRGMVVQYIGLAKNNLARDFLLEQLKAKGETIASIDILNGFQFLGDPTTIPILRAFETDHQLSNDEKELLERTIKIIGQGGRGGDALQVRGGL